METYFEREFIDNFFTTFDKENDAHIDARRLFKSNTLGKVIFDIKDIDELQNLIEENPIFEWLIDGKGYNHVDFQPNFLKNAQSGEFYENSSATKVFFLNEVNDTLETGFAQLVFCNKNISKVTQFIQSTPKSIDKKDAGNWAIFDNFLHPFNSIVILDDYLLTDPQTIIEENLIALLKKIMPKKLHQDIEFQITIIGENANVKLIDKKNKIQSKLTSVFDYKINVSIIPEKVHDRRIFTNYYWINSGYGFTIFESEKVKKETSFTFIPIFCENKERQKEIKKYFQIQKNGKFGEVGTRKNRLLK